MIEYNELLIRPMTHDDLILMFKWLNNETVLEFYDEPPSSYDRVMKKYGPRIDGKHYVIPCIVEYKNESI